MKKTVLLILSLMILLFPTGCTTYSSSYKAIGFVHSNTSDHAEMSFYSFEGKMVFRLKSAGEGDLKFKANLESGTATVYYDYNGIKSELFSIGPGEELDAQQRLPPGDAGMDGERLRRDRREPRFQPDQRT